VPDREKVITAFEVCKSDNHTCSDCPYNDEFCTNTLSADALTLLKEQEAVKPVEVNNKETGCFKCGNCGAVVLSYSYPGIITDKYRSYHQFCGKCGRRVLWEGR